MTIQARLVDLKTTRTLLHKTYRYDFPAATIGYTLLRAAERYGFDAPADVLARPDIAAEGLRAVIPMIVADLAAQLRR